MVLRLLLSYRVPADGVSHGVGVADGRPCGTAVQLRLHSGVGAPTVQDSVRRATGRRYLRRRDLLTALSFCREHVQSRRDRLQNAAQPGQLIIVMGHLRRQGAIK